MFYLLAFFLIVVFVAFVKKRVRKLPVSHSNQSKTTELSAKQSSYLTIKINVSSVMSFYFCFFINGFTIYFDIIMLKGNPPQWA